MSLNIDSLKRKTIKALERMPETAIISREILGEYNEPCGLEYVTEIRGQYYRGGYRRGKGDYTSIKVSNTGQTPSVFPEKFMTVLDENSELIQSNDILELKNVFYTITDLGKNLGVYLDLSLERL